MLKGREAICFCVQYTENRQKKSFFFFSLFIQQLQVHMTEIYRKQLKR